MILDANGKPYGIAEKITASPQQQVADLQRRVHGMMRAKYDAAQTSNNNQMHWMNADNLDPHTSNSYFIRRKLRSRSRYEVIENNPYLKGVILSIANDFVRSGPKIKITDKGMTTEQRNYIEEKFNEWCQEIQLAHKLWRMRMAKIVDGESFMVAYLKENQEDEVKLNLKVVDTERISTPDRPDGASQRGQYKEVDGIRFDKNDEILQYHLLNYYPGSATTFDVMASQKNKGSWIPARNVIHWFRQDRGWFRGIPETTPSLPLCALLRRYTLAVVRAAEVGADFSAVLETEGPTDPRQWTDNNGTTLSDDPFDVFPIDMGMFTVLPWHTKMKQFDAKQPMQVYDVFVNAMLREIIRPLLVPFNVGAGSSQDSNMASAIVDNEMYKSGQTFERFNCNDFVLEKIFKMWWDEAVLIDGHLAKKKSDITRNKRPKHYWRWDRVGIEHTDPSKVANSLQTLFDCGFITDRDIQEGHFSRDVDDWRAELQEDLKFRQSLDLVGMGQLADPNSSQMERKQQPAGGSSSTTKKAKTAK